MHPGGGPDSAKTFLISSASVMLQNSSLTPNNMLGDKEGSLPSVLLLLLILKKTFWLCTVAVTGCFPYGDEEVCFCGRFPRRLQIKSS